MTDETACLQSALDSTGTATIWPGSHLVTGLIVRAGTLLVCAPGATIIPAHPWNTVVRLCAGGQIKNAHFDAHGFSGTLVEINGDDQATSGFALHVRTLLEMSAVGDKGSAAGTALYMRADGIPTARIMGVKATIRVYGMAFAARLRQNTASAPLRRCYRVPRKSGSRTRRRLWC